MKDWPQKLNGKQWGMEFVTPLVRQKLSGQLTWENQEQLLTMLFVSGRPEAVVKIDQTQVRDRSTVAQSLRQMVLAQQGEMDFRAGQETVPNSLGLDPLAEILLLFATKLSDTQIEQLWKTKRESLVKPTILFDKFVPAIQKVYGLRFIKPQKVRQLQSQVLENDEKQKRAWLAMFMLGGVALTRSESSSIKGTLEDKRQSEKSALGINFPDQETKNISLQISQYPSDPELRKLVVQIESTYKNLMDQNCYALFGVASNVSEQDIRKAYFEFAKQWHADRFVKMEICQEAKDMVDDIFRLGQEAQATLCHEEKRKNYDFMLERKAQGLPTDVNVILESEGLFQKGQALLRRGQAAAAEKLLRQAITMNSGEAEFFAYFGFAVYVTKGQAGLEEAQGALNKAQKMNDKLDVVYEFLGRIARTEGKMSDAQEKLKKALEINPRNVEANRELRLLQMRLTKAKAQVPKKGLSGLIGGFLKK